MKKEITRESARYKCKDKCDDIFFIEKPENNRAEIRIRIDDGCDSILLGRKKVKKLIPILQKFVDTGEI